MAAAEQGRTLVSQMPVSRVCPETGMNWNQSYKPQKWTLKPLSPGYNMLYNLHVSFRHSYKRSPPQERCKVPAFFCSACGGWSPCVGAQPSVPVRCRNDLWLLPGCRPRVSDSGIWAELSLPVNCPGRSYTGLQPRVTISFNLSDLWNAVDSAPWT